MAPASTGATNEEMATVINLAGKQRMLSQKMSKEALLTDFGRRRHHAVRNGRETDG